ncbi:MAG: dihydropteroate synthase, partial [Bacteroidia bacterium]|nr:dihydropteroate synthase [Bacteroidia bacterium]
MDIEFNPFRKHKFIVYQGGLVDLSLPLVMGIINITPDSFYDGGRYETENAILKRAEQILLEGGGIIDIGACSTRPGSMTISENDEMNKLLPAVKAVRKHFSGAIISIDTFRSAVARKVIGEAGECIINDISGGTMDEDMFSAVAQLRVPYIIMHIKGTPQNMQANPVYDNVIKDILRYFAEKINKLNMLGVKDIIIDPGFGFGKTLEHNYTIMKHLESFRFLQVPLLVGVSRKSMIYKLLNISQNEALNGTTVLNTVALLKGADILRVHDVKEAVEVVKIVQEMKSVKVLK